MSEFESESDEILACCIHFHVYMNHLIMEWNDGPTYSLLGHLRLCGMQINPTLNAATDFSAALNIKQQKLTFNHQSARPVCTPLAKPHKYIYSSLVIIYLGLSLPQSHNIFHIFFSMGP